tara:strand:- start:455 stop:1753 length:1299 start_codon:yes stop_codon:yes gene_type:complete
MISEKINLGINGSPEIPGDKSISHRSIIIPSISKGICEVSNCLDSDDVKNTLKAFVALGVDINKKNDKIIIKGKGLNSLKEPRSDIYLGNSGTSARLLTGLLSSQNFNSVLTGDESLSKRPMKRIVDPLSEMNAKILTNNNKLPIQINGQKLTNRDIEIKIPSAQIKSGVILAAINTKGISRIVEHNITRDHTEIMLRAFGADIFVKKDNSKKIITIKGKKELKSQNIEVPCDLSSSAFFIVAALINQNSHIVLRNININPTRDGILRALKKMGGRISLNNKRFYNNEQVCDIEVESSELKGCDLEPDIAKLMIDEYPILSIAASFATSPSIFRGLSELRVKESDRLKLIDLNLKNCGVESKIVDDDLFINPSKNYLIKRNTIQTDFDHRIAMAFAIMGSKVGPLQIEDSESIKTSFPTFKSEYNNIGGNIC